MSATRKKNVRHSVIPGFVQVHDVWYEYRTSRVALICIHTAQKYCHVGYITNTELALLARDTKPPAAIPPTRVNFTDHNSGWRIFAVDTDRYNVNVTLLRD